MSTANIALAQRIMSRFAMDNWYELLHDDIVLEFPYAKTLGMPERVAGKAVAVEYLSGVMKHIPGLAFRNVRIEAMADPDSVLVQYDGGCTLPSGAVYDQRYITVQKFKDGRMILFREYWNPVAVTAAFGTDLEAAFS